MKTKAFLFDLNGTMIDDMQYHIIAWHDILNGLGARLTMEEMKQECYGKNVELLERIFPGRFTEKEKEQLSVEKEIRYRKEFQPFLKLLPGLDRFLEEAQAKDIKMAIGSAAITSNIDFVLDGLDLRPYFSVIISADNVQRSKPDPETYLKCAEGLKIDPADCIVFEDTPKGVESALHAGMQAIVITTMHRENEFSVYPNIIRFGNDFNRLGPVSIIISE